MVGRCKRRKRDPHISRHSALRQYWKLRSFFDHITTHQNHRQKHNSTLPKCCTLPLHCVLQQLAAVCNLLFLRRIPTIQAVQPLFEHKTPHQAKLRDEYPLRNVIYLLRSQNLHLPRYDLPLLLPPHLTELPQLQNHTHPLST
jgi:hypothetical protein